MNRNELLLEIVFDPLSQNDTLIPFPEQFDQIRRGWCAAVEQAFMLGQRNPFAPVLMELRADGKAKVSDELVEAETFRETLNVLDELTEDFGADLKHIWDMAVGDDTASAEMEEPHDPEWQIRALEHSLELEKGWSAKLEAEVWDLKRKLRAVQLRNERLRRKRRKSSHVLRPARHPLSTSIAETLRGKRGGLSHDLWVSQF